MTTSTEIVRSRRAIALLQVFILIGIFATEPCYSFSMITPSVIKGSAAKPFDKKKVAVFGSGGYLGACIFGFLQRCGSLYGSGIAGINSPRSITATSTGSVNLNGVLGKHFILAQADESFVKLTDMTSVSEIQSKLVGFDAAFLATRYTIEQRPVTMGTYEKSPNDKTMEFYMDKPRSNTMKVSDDPEYSMELFKKALEACKGADLQRIVVIETDSGFEQASVAGDKYIQMLEEFGAPYIYIIPAGRLENFKDYTYAKGVQGDFKVNVVDNINKLSSSSTTPGGSIFREDLAAFSVQSLLSVDWSTNKIISLECTGSLPPKELVGKIQKEWCVNSGSLESLLSPIA